MKMISLMVSHLRDLEDRRDIDGASLGYLGHCMVTELFGDAAPAPFSVESPHHIVGYAEADLDDLQQRAQLNASPYVYGLCRWSESGAKPMPGRVPAGMTLSYETRVCPVIRKASAGANSSGRSWREGEELDAFLSRVWEVDDESVDIDRGEVYAEWLGGHFGRRGGAELLSCEMESFQLRDMTRRGRGGLRSVTNPDAVLAGKLKVTDPEGFAELLASGIGRHSTFGYGMLKIRA